MTQYTPEHLPVVVSTFEYKPGWEFYLKREVEPDGAGGLTLWIVSDTENSMKPDERIRVHHPFLVPMASYKRHVWEAWLLARCGDVEMHERNEWARFNGVRKFAPHHSNGEDPYITWFVGDLATALKKSGDE